MRIFLNRKRVRALISMLVALAIVLAGGFYLFRASIDRVLATVPRDLLDLPYFIFQFAPTDLPRYELIIDDKDLQQLNDHFAQKTPDDDVFKKRYEPAVFVADGKQYQVKVSYRGDDPSHFINPKKSWRVVFDKDDLFNHQRAINLIIPEDRAFVLEHFNNYRADKLGIAHPQSGFAVLKLNGADQGLYFEIEHWSAEMLEKNNLSPDTNLYGEEDFGDIFADSSLWQKFVESPFQDPADFGELERLLALLAVEDEEVFYNEAEKLVDLENFYRWQVQALLSGSVHQNDDHNVRLYFNRSLGKFQLIAWDVLGNWLDPKKIEAVDQLEHNVLVSRILHNPRFLFERNKILWEYLSDTKNIKDDLAFYNKTWRQVRSELFKDGLKEVSNPQSQKSVWSTRKNIKENFYTLRNLLAAGGVSFEPQNGAVAAIGVVVHSMAPQILESIELRVKNPPAENVQLLYQGKPLGTFNANGNKLELKNLDFAVFSNIGKREATPEELVRTRHVPFFSVVLETNYDFLLTGLAPNEIEEVDIESFNPFDFGLKEEKRQLGLAAAEAHFKKYRPNQERARELNLFLLRHPNFKKLSQEKLSLPAGNHVFYGANIIPMGVDLEISPGARISFGGGASLVVNGAVSALGTAERPIVFTSQNPGQNWGVLAIVGAKKESVFDYAVFERGKDYLGSNGLYASGMLSAYYSPVKITDSTFAFAAADDALNVKYAAATIRNSLFQNNAFDAVDLDFVEGEISDNQFSSNGNDGVDLSGSKVLIFKNKIEGAGDKGISIGERSEAEILENEIFNGNFGVAVKDYSFARIKDSKIYGNEVGLALFQKKLIFGGGQAEISNTPLGDNKDPRQVDGLSNLIQK